jgi:hypothetical protein
MNQEPLSLTNNNLGDILRFLQEGHIVCLHFDGKGKYYYSPTTCNWNTWVYVDIQKMPALLNDDEWPWYFLDAGNEEYTNDDIFTKERKQIYKLRL